MTEAQLNANRENAKKSTGPRSDAGKANSSRNATTHGLTAATRLLPGEDPQLLQILTDDLFTHFRPVGAAEEALVVRIADAQWRLGRILFLETGIIRDYFYNIRIIDHYRGRRYETRKAEAIEDKEPIPERPEIPGPEDLAGRAFNMDCKGPNAIVKLTRYEAGLERSIDRNLRLLQAFQAARYNQPEVPIPAEPVVEPAVEAASTPEESVNCKTKPKPPADPPAPPAVQPMQPNATSNTPSAAPPTDPGRVNGHADPFEKV